MSNIPKEEKQMNSLNVSPFIKINSKMNDIAKVVGKQIETKLSDMFIYVPGGIYYIVDGDGQCGKYATKVISVTIDENGTRIIHKPFECEGNVYNDVRVSASSFGRARYSLDD